MTPCQLIVFSRAVKSEKANLATVSDHKFGTNITGFGMCYSMANPAVQAASAAASGTPTPAACVPNLPAPWVPSLAYGTYDRGTLLTADSTCTCAHAGTIEAAAPKCFIEAR